jgi:hypothetical protein
MEPITRSTKGFCQGARRGGEDLAAVHALDSSRELLAIDRASIPEQEPGNRLVRERPDRASLVATVSEGARAPQGDRTAQP